MACMFQTLDLSLAGECATADLRCRRMGLRASDLAHFAAMHTAFCWRHGCSAHINTVEAAVCEAGTLQGGSIEQQVSGQQTLRLGPQAPFPHKHEGGWLLPLLSGRPIPYLPPSARQDDKYSFAQSAIFRVHSCALPVDYCFDYTC